MKFRVIPIAIVLTLVIGNGHAQDQDSVSAATVLHANHAELNLLDILAAGRDLLIKPSRVSDYWPEYRYSYSAVVDAFSGDSTDGESLCDIASRDADSGDFNLGTIAVFWGEPSEEEGSRSRNDQSLIGWPIVTEVDLDTSGDITWSANDNSWSLDFREFCGGIEAIESAVNNGYNLPNLVNTNVGGVKGINIDAATATLDHISVSIGESEINRQKLYFVTSQALPDQNLEFERVRIQPLPQNRLIN